MPIAPTAFRLTRRSASLGWVIVAAGAILGAVFLIERGPDPVTPPPFAMVPVEMQNGQALFVQVHEVTVAQWNQCHAAGACTLHLTQPDAPQPVDYPATGLSYVDAMEYLAWINASTGQTFRLPSAAEWYNMASEVLPETPDPIFTSPDLTWASAYLVEAQATGRRLRPSGSFSTAESGVSDLDGNVWEWTQDCYGGASGQVIASDRCAAFYMGGEHKAAMSFLIRDPARGGCAVGSPPAHLGMRLVIEASRYRATG